MFHGSIKVFQGSFKEVLRNCQGCFKKFKMCFKEGALRVFQGKKFKGCFNEVSKVFQDKFKGVLRKFQECFRKIEECFEGALRAFVRRVSRVF